MTASEHAGKWLFFILFVLFCLVTLLSIGMDLGRSTGLFTAVLKTVGLGFTLFVGIIAVRGSIDAVGKMKVGLVVTFLACCFASLVVGWYYSGPPAIPLPLLALPIPVHFYFWGTALQLFSLWYLFTSKRVQDYLDYRYSEAVKGRKPQG